MSTKAEIAQIDQFLLLSPCYQLYSIIVLSFEGSFKKEIRVCFQSCLLQICCMRERVYDLLAVVMSKQSCWLFLQCYTPAHVQPFRPPSVSGPMMNPYYYGAVVPQSNYVCVPYMESMAVKDVNMNLSPLTGYDRKRIPR